MNTKETLHAVLLLLTAFLFSILPGETLGAGPGPTVKIIRPSIELTQNNFSVRDTKTILNTTDQHILYVEVTKKKIRGRKYEEFTKVKRKGVNYKVKFIVQNKTNGKKLVRKRSFFRWDDGEVDNTMAAVDIGKYSFKLEVTE